MLAFIYLGLVSNLIQPNPVIAEETTWKRASCDDWARYLFIDENEADSRPWEKDIDVDDIINIEI